MRFDFKTLLYTILIGGALIIFIANFADKIIEYNSDMQQDSPLKAVKNKGTQEKEGTTISFVGDILLASRVGRMIDEHGPDYPFEKVASYLSSSDFSIGNLESAVAVSGAPTEKEYTFRADPMVIGGIKSSGLDIVSLANNHVLDFGTEAFIETLEHLKNGGINYIGAGENIDEAYRPVIIRNKKNEEKIAVFAASRVIPSGSWYAGKSNPGVAGAYNPERLVEEIKRVKGDVEYVAVYLHWGTERELNPNKYQRSLARTLIDNGADIVVGAHPHVLQGFEFYKGKIIAYSLGNFIFTNYNTPTVILNVNLDKKRIKSVNLVPCMIKSHVPEPVVQSEAREDIYRMLEDRSINAKVVDGNIFEYNAGAKVEKIPVGIDQR